MTFTAEALAENHTRYLERIALFKTFGYDIEKERQAILERVRPITGRILEVGTGKGYFAVALAQKGHTFTTIDVSSEEQEFARSNITYIGLEKQVDFKVENAERMSFADASFDTIISVNTIHHLANPVRAIDEIVRVAAPGCKIVISDFNAAGFAVVDRIHQSEGRRHEAITSTLGGVRDHLIRRGCSAEIYQSAMQDILIARC